MNGLSGFGWEIFVAQGTTSLTQCNAKAIGTEFPKYPHWLPAFVTNRIACMPIPTERAAVAFALIRRAQSAIEDYDSACELLDEFIHKDRTISVYFRCLRRFENAMALLYQCLDGTRKPLNLHLFEQGDGSPVSRLNAIYNASRHRNPEKLPVGHLHAVWIRNDGLYTTDAHLLFGELEDLLRWAGRLADISATAEVMAIAAASSAGQPLTASGEDDANGSA